MDGAGHAVRAAAICRRLRNEVLVVRGSDDPIVNRALDYFDVPYITIKSRSEAIRFAQNHPAKTLVLDDAAGSVLDKRASMYIWRIGRPERTAKPMPKVRFEGPGRIGPILMLDDDEILSKEDARDALGLPQDKHITIAVPSTCRPGVVERHPHDYVLTEWPALKYMRAADHIVGCIGANLYGEVDYLGIPATWIKAPHARDQAARIYDLPRDDVVVGAATKIANMIDDLHG